MVTAKTDTPVKSARPAARIRRRLGRQHARWWLRQPQSRTWWVAIWRSTMLVVRRSLLQLRRSIVLKFLFSICLFGVILAGAPWFTFQLVKAFPFGADIDVDRGLAVWCLLANMSIVTLWCFAPGSSHPAPLRHVRKPQRPMPFIRFVSLKHDRYVVQRLWWVSSALGVATLGGLLAYEQWGFGELLVCVWAGTLFWMAWQVRLRLAVHQSSSESELTLWGKCALGWMLLTCVSLMAVAAVPELHRVQRWLGPVAWSLKTISSGSSSMNGSMRIAAVLGTPLLLGWLVRPDIRSWSYRRRFVEVQRRKPPALPRTSNPIVLTSNESEVATDHSAIANYVRRSLRPKSHRIFLGLPDEFRQTWKLVLFLLVVLVGYEFIIFGLLQLHLQPGSYSVAQDGVPVHEIMRSLLSLPVCLAWAASEATAVYHRHRTRTAEFSQRPLSATRFWWDIHRAGLKRTPSQLLVVSLFWLLSAGLGGLGSRNAYMFVAGILLVLLGRSVYGMTTTMLAARPLHGKLIRAAMEGMALGAGLAMFVAAIPLPVATLQYVITPDTLLWILGGATIGVLTVGLAWVSAAGR